MTVVNGTSSVIVLLMVGERFKKKGEGCEMMRLLEAMVMKIIPNLKARV